MAIEGLHCKLQTHLLSSERAALGEKAANFRQQHSGRKYL
jgi:hypothetical protein